MKINKETKLLFSRVETRFNAETLDAFLKEPVEKVGQKYKGSLGAWIRIFVLRKNNPTYRYFLSQNITDKDEMASIIITEFHKYKNL